MKPDYHARKMESRKSGNQLFALPRYILDEESDVYARGMK